MLALEEKRFFEGLGVLGNSDCLAGESKVDLLNNGVGFNVVAERFPDMKEALTVFSKGAAMAKGTTTATGLVHNYFANIFGAPQYHDLHEGIANKLFQTAFAGGVFVGQIRTRLGVHGYELQGPQLAAKALFDLIANQK